MTLPAIATPLSTSGRWIVDANGHRVKLAGLNWAGAHQDQGVPGMLDVMDAATLCNLIAGWGFNSVRFPFSQAGVIGSQASYIPPSSLLAANPALQGMTVWELYQAMVTIMTEAGLMVIPNKHMIYQGWCCSPADSNGLWWNASWTNTQYRTMWTTVAETFASNPLVVGYDLDNEPRRATISGTVYTPTWDGSYSNTDFAGNYIATGTLIQATDTSKLIIAESLTVNPYLSNAATHPVVLNTPNKVVYSTHLYPPITGSGADFATYQQAQNGFVTNPGPNQAPLWIGEFGLANDTLAAIAEGPQGARSPSEAASGYTAFWQAMQILLGESPYDWDWCTWHVSGRHQQGTEPGTNVLQYAKGDRCWDGLLNAQGNGPASPEHLAALQSIMPKVMGP